MALRKKQNEICKFYLFLLLLISSVLNLSAQDSPSSPFPYDSNLNKFMYKGSFIVEGVNSDQLFDLTFYCYDSLHFMKTKKLDKTGLTAVPLDVNDNYGLRKSRSQHWFKDNFNFTNVRNGKRWDSTLVIDATYMTIDNAVMYQYRDFRLDTNFHDRKYNDAIPFEKALKEGFPLESVSWIDERIRERMDEIKQCVLRRKDNWKGRQDIGKDAKLEGR